jgi:hypothetical protein
LLPQQQPLLQRSRQRQQLPNLQAHNRQPAAAVVRLPKQLMQARESNNQLQHSQQLKVQQLVQALPPQQQQPRHVLPHPWRVKVPAVKQDRVRHLPTPSQTSCQCQLPM